MKDFAGPPWHELRVIGTSTPVTVGDLPARLAPIYWHPRQECVYVPAGDVLRPESEEWLTDLCSQGDIAIFNLSVPAVEHHVLLQTGLPAAPEYLPESALGPRLQQLAHEALAEAARLFQLGHRDVAEGYVWYAARAAPRHPVPIMVLHALLRREIPADELAFLEKDLHGFTEKERAQALLTCDLQPLVALVQRSQ